MDIDAKKQIASKHYEKMAKRYKDEKNIIMPDEIVRQMMEGVIKAENSREIQHYINDAFALYSIQNL